MGWTPRGRRGEMGRETGVDRCSLLVLRGEAGIRENALHGRESSARACGNDGMYVPEQQILPHSRN